MLLAGPAGGCKGLQAQLRGPDHRRRRQAREPRGAERGRRGGRKAAQAHEARHAAKGEEERAHGRRLAGQVSLIALAGQETRIWLRGMHVITQKPMLLRSLAACHKDKYLS